MQYLLFDYGSMGTVSSKKAVDANRSLSALSGSGRDLADGVHLKGSYTIEALYIMAITLFAFATVLGAAYRWKEETAESLRLHTLIEIARYQEDSEDDSQEISQGNFPDSAPQQKAGSKAVRKYAEGNGWNLDITAYIPEPEEWLRMISLTDR